MKKVTSLLLLVGVAAFGLVGCGDDVSAPPEQNIRGVSVTPSTLNIAVGETAPLTADVDGDPDNSVSWSSNNTAVATVDANGNVTGVAEGNAAITATSTVDNSQSASAQINVTAVEQARVSIGDITDDGGDPVDVDDVQGQINIEVNVREGDQSISSVDLLVDGEIASTQQFTSANIIEGANAQGEVATIVFQFNTDRAPADATMDGTVVEGEFQNGDREISARANLGSGDTQAATNSQVLTFNNADHIVISRLSGGQGIVNNGAKWWGGEDVVVAATPVVFSGRGVSSVSVDPDNLSTANAVADIGGGNGAAASSSEPFQYTISNDSDGNNDNAVEDIDGGGAPVPTTFTVTQVLDGEGVDISGDFSTGAGTLTELDLHLDFTGPSGGGNIGILLADGATLDDPIMAAGWYQEGGTFVLPAVSDAGVGGLMFQLDIVREGAATDTLYTDVSVTDDLAERDPDAGAVSGTTGGYVGDVAWMADDLGNVGDPAGEPANSNDFGVDFGEPGFDNVLPETEIVFNGSGADADHSALFDTEDVALESGDPGSQVNSAGVTLIVTNTETGDADTVTTASAALSNAGATFTLDPSSAALANTGGVDGPYTVDVMSPDNARLANTGTMSFSFIKDTTPPGFSALDPAPADRTTEASSVIASIGGTISDANEIVSAEISVYDSFNGTCDDGDDVLLDPDAGEIDRNEIDVTDGSNEIEFSESFEIFDPGAGTVTYCYFVTAEDGALLNDGATPDHNADDITTQADITWQ